MTPDQEVRRIARVFPRRLQEALDEEGWGLHDLVFHTGLHESTIQAYMTGRVPKIENLALIARTLDQSADWLLGVFDEPRELQQIVTPSQAEASVLVALAAINDAGETPTSSAIARLSGHSKHTAMSLVRRLQAAGWIHCEQSSHRAPGALSVTNRFHLWWGRGHEAAARREDENEHDSREA